MKSAKNSKKSHRWSLNPATARARASDRARGREADDGLTLIEVMIAFVILMISMVPLGYLLDSTASSAATARQRQAALQLADSWMEILSNSTPPMVNGSVNLDNWLTPTVPPGAQTPISSLAGTNYTVQAYYSLQSVNNGNGQSDLCSSGQPPSPSHPGVIEMQVQVSWGHGQSVIDSTNIDYPQPGVQTDGFLAVQVSNNGLIDSSHLNSAVNRIEALQVSITPTAGGTGYRFNPDKNGCVFAQVPQGNYTVSVAYPNPGTLVGYTGSPPFVTPTGSTTDDSTSVYPTGVPVTVSALQVVDLAAFDEGITTTISYGGASAVDGGAECPGAAALTCLALGNGSSAASAAWGDGGSTWSSTALSNVTNLNDVACTSGGSPTCVGVGYGPNGAEILTTASGFATTSTDTVPSGPSASPITDITKVTCPSANGCYALGTTANGPVLLAGAVGQTAPQSDTWSVVSPASTTFSSLSSIACPATTTCELSGSAVVGTAPSRPEIFRLDGDPATLATNGAWTPTFTTDTLPTSTGNALTVTAVGKVTCPTSTLCLAIAAGDSTSPSDPTILTATIAATPAAPAAPTASTWSNESTFPTGAGSVTGLSCTSTTCMAIGSAGGTGAVWSGDLTQSPHAWSQVTNLPTVPTITSVACGQPAAGDTADCGIAVPGQLLDGSLTGGAWAWNPSGPALPSGVSVQYYTGIACESPPSASRSTCTAVGATPQGPMIATSTNGPHGSWAIQTPSSLSSATVTDIPLEITPANITNWTSAAAPSQTNATTLPVLYPQPLGYSITAAGCPAQASLTPVASLSALAGGSASAIVPLGLLPLQVVSATGAPISGATVTLTSTLCPTDSYTLPVTDAYGNSKTSVPFGTYSYTVTTGTTVTPATALTITVNPSSVVVTNTAPAPPTAVTTYLPGPVQVSQ